MTVHQMVSESKALCGRLVTQGTGRDCGNCARVAKSREMLVPVVNLRPGVSLGEYEAAHAEAISLRNPNAEMIGATVMFSPHDVLDADPDMPFERERQGVVTGTDEYGTLTVLDAHTEESVRIGAGATRVIAEPDADDMPL
jgi:hypothetical protein